jgi:type I restriction enzyme S subunit
VSEPVDIRPSDLAVVHKMLRDVLPSKSKIWVFGSRAKWTATESSDLDLAIDAGRPLTRRETGILEQAFDESDLPYTVDMVDMRNVSENFENIVERDKVPLPLPALSEIVDVNPSVKIPFGEKVPFVDMKQIEPGYKYVYAAETREFAGGGSKFLSGDTLMARITPCLENGKIAQYKSLDGEPANGSTEFIVFRGKKEFTVSDYVYYLVSSPEFRRFSIGQMTGTSGRQRVPTGCFSQFETRLPPLSEQKTISHFLSVLDDKIALNRRINATLEAIAQATFKSWFVDFDPVKAKADGLKLEGMDDETAALFPANLSESSLGLVPEGWTIKPVSEFASYINGAAYKNMHFSNEKDALPVIKIAELKDGISPSTKFTNTNLGEKYCIQTGDILFSWSGSPDTSIDIFLWVGGRAWLNQHIFNVVPPHKNEKPFLFFLLKHLKPLFVEIARDKQTTGLGHVTQKDLNRMLFVFPSANILEEFFKRTAPLLQSIQSNMQENLFLSSVRDVFLPFLVSGRLRVQDSEE